MDRVFAQRFFAKPEETAKQAGYYLTEEQIARLLKLNPVDIQKIRTQLGIR